MVRNFAFMACFSMAMTLLGGCSAQSWQATGDPFMGSTASPARAADVSQSKHGPRWATVDFNMPGMLATSSPGFQTISTRLDSDVKTFATIDFIPQFASTSSAGFNDAAWFVTTSPDSVIVKSEETTRTDGVLAGVETDE